MVMQTDRRCIALTGRPKIETTTPAVRGRYGLKALSAYLGIYDITTNNFFCVNSEFSST